MNRSTENLNILHRNSVGYVARCRCCSEVQISIGNLVAHMEMDSFLNFFKTLKAVAADLDSYTSCAPDGDKILLRTPVKNILISFNLDEFAETLHLFSQAWVLLEVHNVVNDVKK